MKEGNPVPKKRRSGPDRQEGREILFSPFLLLGGRRAREIYKIMDDFEKGTEQIVAGDKID